MFARSLTERVTQQMKTSVNGPLGQVETWADVKTFWASVTEVSADASHNQGKESTTAVYDLIARALERNWSFQKTRFVWKSSDQDNPIVLKPLKNMVQPGRESRNWDRIRCQDITTKADPAQT